MAADLARSARGDALSGRRRCPETAHLLCGLHTAPQRSNISRRVSSGPGGGWSTMNMGVAQLVKAVGGAPPVGRGWRLVLRSEKRESGEDLLQIDDLPRDELCDRERDDIRRLIDLSHDAAGWGAREPVRF